MKLTTITREGGTVSALIEAPTASISVLVKPNLGTADSLRETVEELRTKAARLIRRAELIESALNTTNQ
jgi:tetrahydromethanopterin S-methyltransferase subunit F